MLSPLDRRHLLASCAALMMARPVRAAPPTLEVWKTRGCGCCAAWAKRFAEAGFATNIHEADDLAAIRAAAGVPRDLGGCHTAKVEGYVVEGHVPVAAVQRLLAAR